MLRERIKSIIESTNKLVNHNPIPSNTKTKINATIGVKFRKDSAECIVNHATGKGVAYGKIAAKNLKAAGLNFSKLSPNQIKAFANQDVLFSTGFLRIALI